VTAAAIHVNRAAREIAARNDGLWLDRSGVPHAAQRDTDRALRAKRLAKIDYATVDGKSGSLLSGWTQLVEDHGLHVEGALIGKFGAETCLFDQLTQQVEIRS
jgi:hypothetical protein